MPYLDLFWASWLQIERVGRFLCNECNVLVELNLGCNGLTEVTRNFAVTYQAVYATLLTIEWLHDHTSLYTMVFSDDSLDEQGRFRAKIRSAEFLSALRILQSVPRNP